MSTKHERLARRAQAVQLRSQGWTYTEIGEALGVAESTAYADVTAALTARKDEGVRIMRAVEGGRLEGLERQLQKALDEADATDADTVTKLAGALVRVAERRAKLYGLDMPQRIETTSSAPLTVVLDAGIAAKGGELSLPVLDVD
ncbi:helix-turn-helix domain-containing protein [Kocuria sp. KH4]